MQSGAVWRAHVSSVRGASHERSGAPNQDCGRSTLLGNGSGAVLAVADGHGASLHARSDRGSRFAVDSAIIVLTGWIKSAAGSDDAIRGSAAELPRMVLYDWIARVESDLDRNPPTAGEIASAAPANAGLIERSPDILYGSTVIAAAINDRLAVYLQIGDGDLLTVAADDTVRRAVVGRNNLPINRTESLCQSDANKRFRVQVDFFAATPRPALVLLSTDGYCNSFGDDAAFLEVGRDIKKYIQLHGLPWVATQLEGWLKETTETGSGDDITLAVAWLGPQDDRKKRRRRRISLPWRLLLIAVLLAAHSVPLAWAPQA